MVRGFYGPERDGLVNCFCVNYIRKKLQKKFYDDKNTRMQTYFFDTFIGNNTKEIPKK